ncbi:hypothetical protein [Flavobacterium sp.]|uniref:hypothetical protein n=1 Tax=Flavobacterium sp. TaxID=239 RepID=UPI002608B9CA|nr:hypothetical protein [Flavobacterium sp.]
MTALLNRILGYMLFSALSFAVLGFCLWIKSWWNEPLGGDGFILWFVLFYPVYRAFPVVERLICGPGTN